MPEGEIYIEKRRHKRVEKTFNVTYKVLESSEVGREINHNKRKSVDSADISVSGIQLICDEEFDLDQVLRLDVHIEGMEPLATFAEVRWVSHDSKLNRYRIGMEFLVLKEDHIKAILSITGE